MMRRSLAGRFTLVAAVGILAGAIMPVASQPEPLHVLSSNGLRAVLRVLQPQFERAYRRPVSAEFAPAAVLGERIAAGEAFDVAILTPDVMDAAVAEGHIGASSRVVLARSLAGLAMRAGTPTPSIASVPDLVQALRAASSVGYAAQGASAKPFEALIERLGLDDIRSRLATPPAGSDVGDAVAKGEIQYGVLPLSEIVSVKGLEVAGVFPADVQFPVVMVGGVSARARDAGVAAQLLRFLADERHAQVFEQMGMERVATGLMSATSPPSSVAIDADELQAEPVPHRYVHGVIPDDAKFQLALPEAWNGKLAVVSRGFSGTEYTSGAWKAAVLQKGYAFAASDEGWNRKTITSEVEDSYFESRQRIRELTLYAQEVLVSHYGRRPERTLMMGGSNGGHHTKWMLESYPELFDGGIAGYGFNSQVSQWGSIAIALRHYAVIADRIDDIIAARIANMAWDPGRDVLSRPLTPQQVRSLRVMYSIPARIGGVRYDVGRWPGSEGQWKTDHDALLGYLRDSMPRFDPTFNPGGGPLADDELPLWDPSKSNRAVQRELRRLDLTGRLTRPLVVMHGTADAIVSPGESTGYIKLVQRTVGERQAYDVLATYFIPRMGHGGPEFDALIGAQIDVLEAWIDYRQSGGRQGRPAPGAIGGFPRETRASR